MQPDSSPLSLTRKLLSFNTVNPPGNEGDCAKYLCSLLEESGCEVNCHDFDDSRTTVVAHLRGAGGKIPICFTGHLDTVPLGMASWSKDPFGGETEGGKLYGRGSSDMKAGVAAMVLMVQRLARLPRSASAITLVLTAGEEACCDGARYVVDLDHALGEAGAIVVGEPTSNYPLTGHKGCVRLEIAIKGIAAHASMPELGDNAIHKAARAVIKLHSLYLNAPAHPLLGVPTLNIGTLSGGLNVNSVPDEATIGIDIRTVPGQDYSKIRKSIQEALGEDVEINLLEQATSITTDPKNEWVQEVFGIMTTFLHQRPEASAAAFFTDASFLTPAFGNPPTIILGPGEPSMAHRTDEYCFISKIEEATEAYVEIARKWCGL